MTYDWQASTLAFREATAWFRAVLAEVDGRWDEPGLGEWDVRSLAGHTSRSLITVETYLAQPPEGIEVESATDYYVATRGLSSGPGVAQRGRDAGLALGDDPEAAVAALAERVVPRVEALTGDELLTSIVGGMRLRDYLPTRVLELTVHTADLATALGVDPEPPAVAAGLTLRLLSDLAVVRGASGPLILSATGRVGLPPGSSVL